MRSHVSEVVCQSVEETLNGLLDAETDEWQLWVPPGMAHGFVVTSQVAHFHINIQPIIAPKTKGASAGTTRTLLWPGP